MNQVQSYLVAQSITGLGFEFLDEISSPDWLSGGQVMVEEVRESASVLTENPLKQVEELEPATSVGNSSVDLVKMGVMSHLFDLARKGVLLFEGWQPSI